MSGIWTFKNYFKPHADPDFSTMTRLQRVNYYLYENSLKIGSIGAFVGMHVAFIGFMYSSAWDEVMGKDYPRPFITEALQFKNYLKRKYAEYEAGKLEVDFSKYTELVMKVIRYQAHTTYEDFARAIKPQKGLVLEDVVMKGPVIPSVILTEAPEN